MSTLDVDGVALEVQRIAAAVPLAAETLARCPLVMLHEGLGSVSIWRDWPRQLGQRTGRQVIVYSRQGYGRSDPIADVRGAGRQPPDYMHSQAWQVLPALLKALDIERPILLGHSDGASIALLYASRHPLAASILLAPHVMVEDLSIRSIEQARQDYLQGGLKERLARHHADVDGAFWSWNDAWLNPAFRGFDIRAECRSIRCPLLALQGEDDPYGTAAQIDQILPAGPIERHLLPRCGHSPHRDQPELTTRLVTDFLARLP